MSRDFLKSLDHKLLIVSFNEAKKWRKFSLSTKKLFILICWIYIFKKTLQFIDILVIFLHKNHNNILDLLKAILNYTKKS